MIPAEFSEQPELRPAGADGDLTWAREAARAEEPEANSIVALHPRSALSALDTDFENASADLIAGAALGHAPGPAASWILENGYLVQNEVEEIRRGLEGQRAESRIPAQTMLRSMRSRAVS